ncbi:Ribonuclease D [Candidatus Xenohaliotis californiensis]|uniref:Ribonuclease D n=1 Tax=Candidatus Xenohaliotis californiensis TaxID=84677 RepID=A0ABM9N994_9RICK|nr:Ribonuclease D [Candidatus Xenohaliotis californiensis]
MSIIDNVKLYTNDLPDNIELIGDLAVDTEAMGLKITRDKLCLVQLKDTNGNICLVKFNDNNYSAPNLKKVLSDKNRVKIFHYARFDVAALYFYLNTWSEPVYCTKIASRLVRTYTSAHSLRELCYELLGVRLNKQQQCSNWGAEKLSKEQILYAASDVLHLHSLRDALDLLLRENNRYDLAKRCFECLHPMVELDINGWDPMALFNHSAFHSQQF